MKTTAQQNAEQSKEPRKRSRLLSVLVWFIITIFALVCCSWILGRWIFWFDVISSHQMLFGVLAFLIALLAFIVRRFAAGAVFVILAAVSLWPVLEGRIWSLPPIDYQSKPTDVLRVVSSNIYPENPVWEEDLAELLSIDADVVVIQELPIPMNRWVRFQGYLDQSPYHRWAHRRWVDGVTSPGFILSRWPMDILDAPGDPEFAKHQLFVRVQLPQGEVVIGLVHPKSPRTAKRWALGNAVIQSHAQAGVQIHHETGLPVLLAADLNSGPAQRRARVLSKFGFSMSKPVLGIGGSYPANSPVPSVLQIQLDDVWTIGPAKPVAWSMLEIFGSDHQAVIADFKIDGESTP